MKINQRLAVMLFSFLAFQTIKADNYELYLVGLEGDSFTSLDFANLQSLSFSQSRETNADDAVVYVNRMSAHYSDGSSKEFDLANFSAIRFADATVDIDDVRTTTSSESTFSISTGKILTQCSGKLTISQLDGRMVYEQTVSEGDCVNLSSFAKGIYIVNLGGQSAKLFVK